MNSGVVVISLERYDELLESETRVDIITDYLNHTRVACHDELYLLLGNTKKAKEAMQEKTEKLERIYRKGETEE